MKRLNEITIADLMPDSISGDAQVSETARAIDPQLRLISEAVDRPLILAAIDDLSAGVLEHLAVQYDVTAWDSAWPIETKRAVLKTAIADKRKKGTRGAVERAIEAVASIATLTEWWQDTSGDMPPHTFKVDLLQDGSAVDPETQANVIAQVEEAKPVRSHYAFKVGQLMGGDLYFAGVLRAISYARVRSAGISVEQTNIDAGVLAALRGMSIRRLLANTHMGEMPEPEPPQPQYIEVILGFILSGSANNPPSVNNMRAVTFGTNDYWFGYILNSADVDAVTAFGLTYNEDYLINWNNSFKFEPLDLYTDDGQTSAGFDMSNFYCGGSSNTPSRLCIKNYTATSTNTLTWKCRITKREVVPYIEVLFGLRYQDGIGWQSKTFSANDYWYGGILSETDKQDLQAFGCTFVNSEADHKQGPIGTINGNDPNFTFEPIALYSDLAGQNENVADMSNFYCYYGYSDRLQIRNYSAYNTPSVTWKCRITRNV